MGIQKPTRLFVDQGSWPVNIETRCRGTIMRLCDLYIFSSGTGTEYFCTRCRKLCLSLTQVPTYCSNCGCKDLITGKPGSLDKAALIRKLDGLTE